MSALGRQRHIYQQYRRGRHVFRTLKVVLYLLGPLTVSVLIAHHLRHDTQCLILKPTAPYGYCRPIGNSTEIDECIMYYVGSITPSYMPGITHTFKPLNFYIFSSPLPITAIVTAVYWKTPSKPSHSLTHSSIHSAGTLEEVHDLHTVSQHHRHRKLNQPQISHPRCRSKDNDQFSTKCSRALVTILPGARAPRPQSQPAKRRRTIENKSPTSFPGAPHPQPQPARRFCTIINIDLTILLPNDRNPKPSNRQIASHVQMSLVIPIATARKREKVRTTKRTKARMTLPVQSN